MATAYPQKTRKHRKKGRNTPRDPKWFFGNRVPSEKTDQKGTFGEPGRRLRPEDNGCHRDERRLLAISLRGGRPLLCHLLEDIRYFPLLVLRGIHQHWTYFVFVPGALLPSGSLGALSLNMAPDRARSLPVPGRVYESEVLAFSRLLCGFSNRPQVLEDVRFAR